MRPSKIDGVPASKGQFMAFSIGCGMGNNQRAAARRGERIEAHPNPEWLLRCAPDLAVEIDLTSGKKPRGQQRMVDYLEAGVRLVWAIDPHNRTAMVYHPDGSARLLRPGEALDGEGVVPDFRLELSELFG